MPTMLWSDSVRTARSACWSRWPAGSSATLSVLALLALGGCDRQAPADRVVTVDLKGSPAASASPPEPAENATPAPAKGAGKPLQALGTEPFWSLEVRPEALRYSSPEELEGIEFAVTETVSGTGWRFSGTLQGKPAVLTVEPGQCSDGMSDTVYPYTARFTWGGETQQGCARER